MSRVLEQTAKTEQIRQINISSLQDLPVKIRNISDSAKIAHVDSAMPIRVGRVKNLLYTINDFEIVQGLIKLGINQMTAIITDYSSMRDLIVAHVHENFHPRLIEPLLIHQVIEYVTAEGMSFEKACKLLWLDQRKDLYATTRCKINEKARGVLLEMSQKVSRGSNSPTTPVYYITLLAKIDNSEQYMAAKEMADITLAKKISGATSFWPTSEMFKTIHDAYHRKKDVPPTEKRTVVYDELRDVAKSKKKNKKKPSRKDVKKAENYIGTDPSLVYAPIDADHPDIIFNKKTGRAALAENRCETFAMIDDIGRQTHVLPPDAIGYLDPEDSEKLFVYKYPTLEKAQDALSRTKISDRCIVISKSKIPES